MNISRREVTVSSSPRPDSPTRLAGELSLSPTSQLEDVVEDCGGVAAQRHEHVVGLDLDGHVEAQLRDFRVGRRDVRRSRDRLLQHVALRFGEQPRHVRGDQRPAHAAGQPFEVGDPVGDGREHPRGAERVGGLDRCERASRASPGQSCVGVPRERERRERACRRARGARARLRPVHRRRGEAARSRTGSPAAARRRRRAPARGARASRSSAPRVRPASPSAAARCSSERRVTRASLASSRPASCEPPRAMPPMLL